MRCVRVFGERVPSRPTRSISVSTGVPLPLCTRTRVHSGLSTSPPFRISPKPARHSNMPQPRKGSEDPLVRVWAFARCASTPASMRALCMRGHGYMIVHGHSEDMDKRTCAHCTRKSRDCWVLFESPPVYVGLNTCACLAKHKSSDMILRIHLDTCTHNAIFVYRIRTSRSMMTSGCYSLHFASTVF
jgi:hypothetical protein